MSNVNDVFSGGEKQLICLGRAILRQSKVIILEERKIQKFNCDLLAHRLNTIADYDKIFVLENGSVAEQGVPYYFQGNGSLNWINQFQLNILVGLDFLSSMNFSYEKYCLNPKILKKFQKYLQKISFQIVIQGFKEAGKRSLYQQSYCKQSQDQKFIFFVI
ncbi:hypothetical protein ABPG72_021880 [Tetrahymena utriculariae]